MNAEKLSYQDMSDEALCLVTAQGDALAEECLILRYRRTVLISSRSFFLLGGENEDLVQEGMVGLLKAILL
jgi:RNA polymerase sporulation-specific sigma factor